MSVNKIRFFIFKTLQQKKEEEMYAANDFKAIINPFPLKHVFHSYGNKIKREFSR